MRVALFALLLVLSLVALRAEADASGRVAQPPIAVAPPIIEPPAPPANPVAITPRPIPPAVQIDRPATLTACDATGCWANDGSRLQRVGPNLSGPTGSCAIQGAFAVCP